MSATPFPDFVSAVDGDLAVILGINETASALAVKLRKTGYRVILSHEPCPPVLRRGMAFADALFDDPVTLDGVSGRRAESGLELAAAAGEPDCVAVTPLQFSDLLALRRIQLLVDARLKPSRAMPDYRHYVGLAVGLGRHFTAGENCDLALDAHPTRCEAIYHCIGSQPCEDCVAVHDPAFAMAPATGLWHTALEIGETVGHGDLLGRIGGASVRAPHDGLLLGLARDGLQLPEGAPVAEVAMGAESKWFGLDARAVTLAESTLAAIASWAQKAKDAPRHVPGAP
jgi:hypothetical protein